MADPASVRHVAMLAPMRPELRPLVKAAGLHRVDGDGDAVYRGSVAGAQITAMMTGIGTAAATRVTHAVLDLGPCDHVIVVGIAGGVDPTLDIGDVVVPERAVDRATGREFRSAPLGGAIARGSLITSDELISDPTAQARLAEDGYAAIDMETAAIAAVCEQHGLTWSAFRGISDHGADDGIDDSVLGLSKPDGTADMAAVAKFVATRPWRVPNLARLGRNMQKAVDAAVASALSSLSPSTTR
jgi:adenosylhomocysteine nucleosidase